MRILAIETACPPGSIALAEVHADTAEVTMVTFHAIDDARRTTRTFAVILQDVLARAGWQPSDIDLVAVTDGPGSFTGLRIGVTAAKVFAYATNAEVVGLNTLEVIARQVASDYEGVVEAVLNAQRGELFAARFHTDGKQLEVVKPTSIIAAEKWLAERVDDALVTGPGLVKYEAELAEANVADSGIWIPRADTLAKAAATQAGAAANPKLLAPNYYRKSAAEEKADKLNS